VVPREVLAEVELARKLGYAFSLNRVTPGAGVLAASLLRSKDQPMLVLGIGGISSNMTQNKDQLIEALQRHIAEYHLNA